MVRERIDRGRRRLLEAAAMTIAGARLGAVDIAPTGGQESSLEGKVVLVQFCTYTCINWLRTLPYVRAWAQKYRQGLVVIGVHTPEFEFEHNVDNVRRAMQQMQVEYPIVIDNDYSIWRAFRNQYWPALYLVDGRGRTRHHHFGEGEYQQSELAVRRLLPAAGAANEFVAVNGAGIEAPADWSNVKTPETYIGSGRDGYFSNRNWSLSGGWTIGSQAARLGKSSGRLVCRFHARDLHLVMGPSRPGTPIRFRVLLDGQPPAAAHGLDIDANGNGAAVDQRLYQLIRQPGAIAERRFEIEFLDPGIEAFAFTFG
jgi:thiol-disulfide isomerase/thioredoxin